MLKKWENNINSNLLFIYYITCLLFNILYNWINVFENIKLNNNIGKLKLIFLVYCTNNTFIFIYIILFLFA